MSLQITAAMLESIEALERLDIPISDVHTTNDLRQMLLEEFGITGVSSIHLTNESLNKMLKISQFVQRELMPQGIMPTRIVYPSGKVVTRFGIKGAPGLFGVNEVNKLLSALYGG